MQILDCRMQYLQDLVKLGSVSLASQLEAVHNRNQQTVVLKAWGSNMNQVCL